MSLLNFPKVQGCPRVAAMPHDSRSQSSCSGPHSWHNGGTQTVNRTIASGSGTSCVRDSAGCGGLIDSMGFVDSEFGLSSKIQHFVLPAMAWGSAIRR